MKRLIFLPALAIAICVFLTGCPVSSKFPLAEQESAEPFNKLLSGTWINSKKDAEASRITIEKGDVKNTYLISVLSKGSLYAADSDRFLAWVTKIDDLKFIVLKEINDENKKGSYYVYNFSVEKNNLITNDISLLVKGIDAITSVQSYREEVAASMKKEKFLAEKTEWTKE